MSSREKQLEDVLTNVVEYANMFLFSLTEQDKQHQNHAMRQLRSWLNTAHEVIDYNSYDDLVDTLRKTEDDLSIMRAENKALKSLLGLCRTVMGKAEYFIRRSPLENTIPMSNTIMRTIDHINALVGGDHAPDDSDSSPG